MNIQRATTHVVQAIAEGTLLAILVVGLVAGTTLAGKGGTGGKPGGTIPSSFVVDDGAFATTTFAHGGTGTWVHAICYQNGSVVYEQYVKYSDGTATLTLGPTPSWSSGGATCVGEDGWWRNGTRWRVIAKDAFTVSG